MEKHRTPQNSWFSPTSAEVPLSPEEKAQKMGKFITLLALIPSALVATCCLGPLLFILLGVSASSVSALKVFTPYKPYFLALGILALTYAFYLLYMKKNPVECACDVDPVKIRTKKMNRILFWIVVAIFVTSSIYPYVLKMIL